MLPYATLKPQKQRCIQTYCKMLTFTPNIHQVSVNCMRNPHGHNLMARGVTELMNGGNIPYVITFHSVQHLEMQMLHNRILWNI